MISRRKVLQGAVAIPVVAAAASLMPVVARSQASPSKAKATDESSTWHAYLTDEELQHPLADYWFRRPAISEDVLADLRKGPIENSKALAWEDRTKLSDPGDLSVENGYSTLSDGTRFIAVRTRFPGCTAEMIDWWFKWAQKGGRETICYKIWYPGAHYAMSEMPTPGYQRRKGDKYHWGMTRFPVEDIGSGVGKLRLDFVNPREFGFDGEPEGGTILCCRVGMPDGSFKHTEFIHYVRPIQGGVEMRSRFWQLRKIEPMAGGSEVPQAVRDMFDRQKSVVGPEAGSGMAFHCATEYAQLAGFLAELYRKYGP